MRMRPAEAESPERPSAGNLLSASLSDSPDVQCEPPQAVQRRGDGKRDAHRKPFPAVSGGCGAPARGPREGGRDEGAAVPRTRCDGNSSKEPPSSGSPACSSRRRGEAKRRRGPAVNRTGSAHPALGVSRGGRAGSSSSSSSLYRIVPFPALPRFETAGDSTKMKILDQGGKLKKSIVQTRPSGKKLLEDSCTTGNNHLSFGPS